MSEPLDHTGAEYAGSAYIFSLVDADFNDDGLYDVADIDLLVAAIASGTDPVDFDLTGDGFVDLSDRDAWLAAAGAINLPSGNPYLLGDANLDGSVDGSDFGIWNAHKFTSVAAWSRGDFNADRMVDSSDFDLWSANKFQSANAMSRPLRVVSVDLLRDRAKYRTDMRPRVSSHNGDRVWAALTQLELCSRDTILGK